MSGTLASALALAKRAASISDSCLVALSGGKDSLVTLDVCCQAFSRVEAFFMYIVPGLESIEGPARRAAERAGVPLHFVQHWIVPSLLKAGIYNPITPEIFALRNKKIADVELFLRRQTGIEWCAYGWRRGDSMQRALYLRQVQGLAEKPRKLYPVWEWSTNDVLGYLRLKRIPLPPRRDKSGGDQRGTSGFEIDERTMIWMAKHEPEDFARVERYFPFVRALVERARLKAAQAPAL